MTKEEEKYTTLDIDQCKWWVNHLFSIAKEKACNSHNFDDAEEIQAAQDKILKALEQQPSDDVMAIHTQGLAEGIRCAMCTNSMKSDRGCDGGCVVNEDMYKEVMNTINNHIFEQPTSDDCVSRAEVFEIMGNLMSIPYDFDRPINEDDVSESMDRIKALPPVTPTHCIAAVRFIKDDLREICNERIEIECTHGTCKDCENWDKECHYCFMLDCDTGKDFYCKGLEKRGDSDDSN